MIDDCVTFITCSLTHRSSKKDKLMVRQVDYCTITVARLPLKLPISQYIEDFKFSFFMCVFCFFTLYRTYLTKRKNTLEIDREKRKEKIKVLCHRT